MVKWNCEPGICYYQAIPYIIMAAGTALSAHSANKSRQQAGDLAKKQTGIFNKVEPSANQFLGQSQQAIGPALNYYTSMMANPREATAQEQNRISTLYAGQANNVRTQSPRGGYGPAAAERLRGQERAAQEGVIQSGRPMAAQGLGNMGLGLAGLGYQGYGLGAGILGNVFGQGMANRQQSYTEGSGAGQGLFNAYQAYLLGNSMGGPGNTTQSQGYSGPGMFSSQPSPYSGGFNSFKSGQPGLYGGSTLPNSGPPTGYTSPPGSNP